MSRLPSHPSHYSHPILRMPLHRKLNIATTNTQTNYTQMIHTQRHKQDVFYQF
jgi:hypothetical protein